MGDADFGVDFLPEYFNFKCDSKFQNLAAKILKKI